MTTDLYARPIFADGQGIELTDMQALGGLPLAVIWDQIVSTLPMDVSAATTGDPTFNSAVDLTVCPYAYALTSTGARPIQGSANNKIKISRGTLLQAIATPDGTEPKLLAFAFTGNDELTIANGDPTNPRVDIIQMQLSYLEETANRDFKDGVTDALTSQPLTHIRRRVQCVLSVKQGTPAASPLYPLADAGKVLVAGVLVNATYAAALPFVDVDSAGFVAALHDQRLPIGAEVRTVLGNDLQIDTALWQLSLTGDWVTSLGGQNTTPSPATAVCRYSGQARIVGITTVCDTKVIIAGPTTIAAAVSGKSGRYLVCDGGSGIVATPSTSIAAIYGNKHNALTGGTIGPRRRHSLINTDTLHNPVAGPTITSNAAGVTAPMWTSGRRIPRDPHTLSATANSFEAFCFMYEPDLVGGVGGLGLVAGPVTFHLATGLL